MMDRTPVAIDTADLLWTVDEAAERLRAPRHTIYHWIKTGELHAIRLGRRSLRIRQADLEAFIGRGREQA